jgi:hypothetical protein
MTKTFTGRFDGRVIVPTEPVELPTGRSLTLTVRDTASLPEGVSGLALAELARQLDITPREWKEIDRAIEQGCEQVNPDDWK